VLLKTLTNKSMGARAVVFSPDGRLLATASSSSTITLWSLPDGALLKTISQVADSLAISPDGRLLVSAASGEGIVLWTLPDGTLLKTISGFSPSSFAISPDGRLLICAAGAALTLWSLPDGRQLPVCLMDPAASYTTVGATTYTKEGVTYTIPGGQPIPSGAVCTCNTVAGSLSGGGSHYWYPN
jgi:WD40 repeat protein